MENSENLQINGIVFSDEGKVVLFADVMQFTCREWGKILESKNNPLDQNQKQNTQKHPGKCGNKTRTLPKICGQKADVLIFYKPEKNPIFSQNYRPFSLLSTISKDS